MFKDIVVISLIDIKKCHVKQSVHTMILNAVGSSKAEST